MNFQSDHSWLEKLIHSIAFSSWYPRLTISEIESSIYKSRLGQNVISKPVFITALPRAGTTLLLELCVNTGEFGSHSYKDMPFIFSPILWNHLSKGFRHSQTQTERVHGDGIYIDVDSSESFEEILWKVFWASRYKKNRIIPWTGSRYPKFEEFFLENMRKIIFLRGGSNTSLRYISKNNLNIARINYLRNAFPDAIILIPFRNPLQHASSLLRQHLNFMKIHREDQFARKYMEDTGHFDFGENLRPVDFNKWLSEKSLTQPDTLSFWLMYWINTYQYLLTQARDYEVCFFSFDKLCADPKIGLEKLGDIVEIGNPDLLLKNVSRIQKPSTYKVDQNQNKPETLQKAMKIFNQLTEITGG